MTASNVEAQRSAVVTAATTLWELSDRMSKAASALARMVARLATEDDATKVVFSITKYVNSGMPESDAVADVAAVLEGAQPAEWQEKRATARRKSQMKRLEWQLSRGEVNEHDRPSFGGFAPELAKATVLDVARKRRDLMAAAIAACEQRADSAEILASLGRFMTGEDGVWHFG
jgi:hypothetical protein